MARRPFFSGNYGSALGSTANAANLIARAGEAQGRMFANLGGQIGGMIQQYGLNKEKQKKNEGFIKSQSSMLDMLAEQDPDMAPQYAAYKENLNNPDVPLSTRVEFGKNLVNNITLSTQLQGQRLMQATQAQSLKEQKSTEKLRNDLLVQKKAFNDLGIELKQLEADKGKATSTAEIQNILAKYGLSGEQIEAERELLPKKTEALGTQLDTNIMQNEARQETLPSTTDATIASNVLSKAIAEENLGLLPQRTQLTKEQIKTNLLENQVRQDSIPEQAELDAQKRQLELRKLDVENEFMDIVGIKNYAKMKADDLKTMSDINKAKLKQTSAAAEYYMQKGMADLITAANKANPSFKDSYAPILEMQGKLLTTKVVVPGSKERITLEDYLKEHENDKDKYPLNGLPGHLHGLLLQFEKSGQDLIKSQTVQVNVPDANQAQDTQVANQSDLLQAIEKIPSVRANREANIRRNAELVKERREIFDDPNSNIYLY